MISLKKYLTQDTRADQTLVHAVRNLVQGIGQHAIAGEADDCARFHQNIRKISAALAEEAEPDRVLGHADSVLKEFEEYNRHATWFHRFQTIELQNMVKMLTSTVGTISATSQANVRILGDIERQVAVISELDNVRMMKAKLSTCLTEIRQEAQRQQLETGKTIQELRRRLDGDRKDGDRKDGDRKDGDRKAPTIDVGAGAAVERAAIERAKDTVTGLPLREEAEAAVIESANIGSRTYAAAMVFDRLQLLNARFGKQAGDEILAAFTRMVQSHLNPEDRMFRWGGPVFLALLPRLAGFEQVRREIGDVIENKLDHTIQTASRSVLIPITARWNLFPVTEAPEVIFRKIDEFAASATVRM